MRRGPNRSIEGQLDLFGADELPPPVPRTGVHSAAFSEGLRQLGLKLPEGLFLGTSSWSFPGWEDVVYAKAYSEAKLAKEGLAAYAAHPLLRAVGLDRTYYSSIGSQVYREYANSVPEGFRFLVKAPEILTVQRFPQHPRYQAQGGELNPNFLSSEVAVRELIEPARQGLGAKLGCLLFQFPPQSPRDLGGSRGFAARLYQFLEELPAGLPYAVEIRNRELFGPAYRDVLERLQVSHCLNIHPQMADFDQQLEAASRGSACVVRWMLNPRLEKYEDAVARFSPFARLQMEDIGMRVALARLCRDRVARGQVTLVIVNNKAEGCAPLSLQALAQCILEPPPFE